MALNNHPSNFTSEQTSKKTGKPEQLKSSGREISSLMKEKQPQQLVPSTIQPLILRRNNSLSSLLTSENHQQSDILKNQSKNNVQNFKNYDSSSIYDARATSTSHPIIRRNSSTSAPNTQNQTYILKSRFVTKKEPKTKFADELPASRTNKGHNKQFPLNKQYNIPSDMISFLQESFEIFTPQGNYIGFSSDGELSIHWRCNDKTVIRPDGNRYEYYGLELEEIYLASGEAYRSSASKKWRREKFTPNLSKMNERQDGSYSALDKREGRDKKFLRIVSDDFTLKRDMSTKTITVSIFEEPFSRTWIEYGAIFQSLYFETHFLKSPMSKFR
uniref:Uncharacterized protein n=1 Tax=Meloidogyne javanica TaxID=6303 RepID=A0A915NAC2_MELJA